ncbi:MAG: outer-membrane lipoprotein carrier protein LolA, partial [Salinisphaera sp.]|nr:outer-membrane lipoprotein carrier protein LolA [Salinisphaera sp.]
SKPYQQIIISDGDTFRFYDVGLSQVTIRPVTNGLRATPAQLLAGGTALDQAFEVSPGGRHDGLAWVQLVPSGKYSDFKEIRIGLDGSTPTVMELDDKLGGTTRIQFTDIKTNTKIDPQQFTLEIP